MFHLQSRNIDVVEGNTIVLIATPLPTEERTDTQGRPQEKKRRHPRTELTRQIPVTTDLTSIAFKCYHIVFTDAWIRNKVLMTGLRSFTHNGDKGLRHRHAKICHEEVLYGCYGQL